MPEIGQLANLTILGLSYNQLVTFTLEITKLSKLTNLNVGGNQLISLPPLKYPNSSILLFLNLYNNQLDSLPLK